MDILPFNHKRFATKRIRISTPTQTERGAARYADKMRAADAAAISLKWDGKFLMGFPVIWPTAKDNEPC